jgi:DNA repair metallo-beta-lactamase
MEESRVFHLLSLQDMSAYLNPLRPQFDHVLAFEPTGWTYSNKTLSVENIRPRVCNAQLTLYGKLLAFLKPE